MSGLVGSRRAIEQLRASDSSTKVPGYTSNDTLSFRSRTLAVPQGELSVNRQDTQYQLCRPFPCETLRHWMLLTKTLEGSSTYGVLGEDHVPALFFQ